MKRNLLALLILTVSATLFAEEQYFIRVNGTRDYAATQLGEPDFQERTQYLAKGIQLQAGDIVCFYDAVTNAEFYDAALEPYDDGAKFTQTPTGFTCNQDGCYDFYLKLKWEDNTLYIGPGTECGVLQPTDHSGQGEQPGTDPGTNPGTGDGTHTYWLIGWFDGQDVGDASDFNGIHDEYKFQNGKLHTKFTNNSGAGFSYACVKDSEGNWYMTKAWDDNINTASSVTLYWTGFQYSEPNKWRLPNETDLYIIMESVGFQNEIRLRLVDKNTFDAYKLDDPAAGLDNISDEMFTIVDGKVVADGVLRIYTITGQDVTNQNGTLNGLYVVSVNGKSSKVLVK